MFFILQKKSNNIFLLRLIRPYAKSAEILSHSYNHETKGFTRLRRVRKDGRWDAIFPRRTEMLLFHTTIQIFMKIKGVGRDR